MFSSILIVLKKKKLDISKEKNSKKILLIQIFKNQ